MCSKIKGFIVRFLLSPSHSLHTGASSRLRLDWIYVPRKLIYMIVFLQVSSSSYSHPIYYPMILVFAREFFSGFQYREKAGLAGAVDTSQNDIIPLPHWSRPEAQMLYSRPVG